MLVLLTLMLVLLILTLLMLVLMVVLLMPILMLILLILVLVFMLVLVIILIVALIINLMVALVVALQVTDLMAVLIAPVLRQDRLLSIMFHLIKVLIIQPRTTNTLCIILRSHLRCIFLHPPVYNLLVVAPLAAALSHRCPHSNLPNHPLLFR